MLEARHGVGSRYGLEMQAAYCNVGYIRHTDLYQNGGDIYSVYQNKDIASQRAVNEVVHVSSVMMRYIHLTTWM